MDVIAKWVIRVINSIQPSQTTNFKGRAKIAKDIAMDKVPRKMEEIFAQTDKLVKKHELYKDLKFTIQLRDILTVNSNTGQKFSLLEKNTMRTRTAGKGYFNPKKNKNFSNKTRNKGAEVHEIKVGIVPEGEPNVTTAFSIQEFFIPFKSFNMKEGKKKLADTLNMFLPKSLVKENEALILHDAYKADKIKKSTKADRRRHDKII